MIEFAGIMLLKTGMVLSPGEWYPRGRHLRGACGYIALFNDMEIKKIFIDQNNEDIMFFDLLPYCKCNNLFFKQCSKCGMTLNNYLSDARTTKKLYKEFKEGLKYRLRIIAKNDLADVVSSILKEIKNNGIYIGKYKSEGKGKLVLTDYKYFTAKPIIAEKGRLVSDAVMPNGTKDIIFTKSIIDEKYNIHFKEIVCKTVPAGSVVELKDQSFNGFAVGQYKGLGFGEVIKV